VKSSGATNVSAYELWNEPDWTWNTSAAGAFDAGWATTYKEDRANDANTPIQGPSYSAWNQSWMSTFLTDAKASGTVPGIVSWHELQGSQNIAAHVSAYRALESSLGISPRPISIEEYGTTSEVGVPGQLVGYVAKFERAGIHDAELAFWNHYGTLGDTLTDTGGSPNGSYWLYKWYGDMSGNMLTTTPPAQTGIDGAAALTGDGRQISVIFGGGVGSTAVQVNGLGSLSAFGGTVHVKLEYTPSKGRTTAVSAPITVSDADGRRFRAVQDQQQGERTAARHHQREHCGRRHRPHLGRQRHRRPPLAADPGRGRHVQDRQLQQRTAARRDQHEHHLRCAGPAMGRQRDGRPSVEPDRTVTR
jgi:hypothetical protein